MKLKSVIVIVIAIVAIFFSTVANATQTLFEDLPEVDKISFKRAAHSVAISNIISADSESRQLAQAFLKSNPPYEKLWETMAISDTSLMSCGTVAGEDITISGCSHADIIAIMNSSFGILADGLYGVSAP